MKRFPGPRAGFTLIEMMLATTIGGLLCIMLVWFSNISFKSAAKVSSQTLAEQLLDKMFSDIHSQFKRRDFPDGLYKKDPELYPLSVPAAFAPPAAGTVHCQDEQAPTTCQNLKVIQLASVDDSDPKVSIETHREVSFETRCQDPALSPSIPPGTQSSDFQTKEGNCSAPPQASMIRASYPIGNTREVTLYQGEKIIGTSLCFHSCSKGEQYQVEGAVSYQGANNQWAIVQRKETLSLLDVSNDIQIIPQ